MFLTLPPEIVIHWIIPNLTDRERLNLVSVSKPVQTLYRSHIYFTNQVAVEENHVSTWYFHQLRNIWTSLTVFPGQITHLTFNYDFNQCFTTPLPSSITHLVFGHTFSKSIKGILPSELRYLEFGYWFNEELGEITPEGAVLYLPYGLSHLVFQYMCPYDLPAMIPSTVTHLTIHRYIKIAGPSPLSQMPLTVTHLMITGVQILPKQLV